MGMVLAADLQMHYRNIVSSETRKHIQEVPVS